MNSDVFWVVFPLWIKAFVLTLSIEIPLFVLLGKIVQRVSGGAEVRTLRLALAGAFGTCFTHPLLWFFWPQVVHDYTTYIVSGEALVAVIESVTFYAIARPIKLSKAAIVSFAANAASWGLGALIASLTSSTN